MKRIPVGNMKPFFIVMIGLLLISPLAWADSINIGTDGPFLITELVPTPAPNEGGFIKGVKNISSLRTSLAMPIRIARVGGTTMPTSAPTIRCKKNSTPCSS